MEGIKVLENVLNNLENKLEDIDIYNYEKYPEINNFIEEYKIRHREEVNRYLEKEGRLHIEELDDLDFTDILYMISSQIEEIKEAVKKDLKSEYERVININGRIGDKK